jgi:hypothetical protein
VIWQVYGPSSVIVSGPLLPLDPTGGKRMVTGWLNVMKNVTVTLCPDAKGTEIEVLSDDPETGPEVEWIRPQIADVVR